MTLRAVIFDWGGTLSPWRTVDARQAWIATVADEELADRLLAAEEEVWQRSRRHSRSGRLEEVFAAAGVEPTERMLAAFAEWWEPYTVLDPEAPAVLEALRDRGMRIGVLSNTIWPRAHHERFFERDGVAAFIDGAVYTSEIEWTKPHPKAFEAALAAVAVDDPRTAVFVGDRLFDDIHGAKAAGLRAVLVPHSDIPEAQKGPVEGQPDAVIDRLSDLVAVVDAWR